MPTEITRQELYEKIWERPMVHVAADYGISGNALKKYCTKYHIPVPGRGYWARKRHGKKDPRTPFPPRGLGLGDDISIGASRYWNYYRSREGILNTPIGPVPVFTEDVKTVRRRARKLVGDAPFPADLSKCHRLLATYLKKDAARREAYNNARYKSLSGEPLFEGAFERRRLKILNGLFTMLTRASMSPGISRSYAIDLGCTIGETFLKLRLDSPARINDDGCHWGAREEPSTSTMRLEIEGGADIADVRTVWQDGRGSRIEKSLRGIAVEIIVAGEMEHRSAALRHHDWLVKRRADLLEKMEQERQEALKEEAERLRKLEAARIGHLFELGERYRKASSIREMVASLGTAIDGECGDVSREELTNWRNWALSEAAQMDPVTSGLLSEAIRNRDAGVDPELLVPTPGLPDDLGP